MDYFPTVAHDIMFHSVLNAQQRENLQHGNSYEFCRDQASTPDCSIVNSSICPIFKYVYFLKKSHIF